MKIEITKNTSFDKSNIKYTTKIYIIKTKINKSKIVNVFISYASLFIYTILEQSDILFK